MSGSILDSGTIAVGRGGGGGTDKKNLFYVLYSRERNT